MPALSIPDFRFPRRCLVNRRKRAHISTSTNRHITGIRLDAAVYRFAGAYFSPAEVEFARYVRSFADADVPFAGVAR